MNGQTNGGHSGASCSVCGVTYWNIEARRDLSRIEVECFFEVMDMTKGIMLRELERREAEESAGMATLPERVIAALEGENR